MNGNASEFSGAPVIVSVIIPTHNPDPERLRSVLQALRAQNFPSGGFELIIVDNASKRWPAPEFFREIGSAGLRLVREPELGLSAARRRGLEQARGQLAVLVDDDNLLAPDYLHQVVELFSSYPKIGVIGGKSLPAFTAEPPDWVREFFPLLALRDLGDTPLVSEWNDAGLTQTYPPFAPIGAGMALRKEAWTAWLEQRRGRLELPDRAGESLSSSGDNDLVLCALRRGWEVAYFPQLRLRHQIPDTRLQPDYLGRINRATQQSWMRVLALHEVSPWPRLSRAGAWMRKVKAWLVHQPWRSPVARIRWLGACGHFDGRVAPTPTAALRPVSSRRQLARQLGLGRLNYLAWHAPLAQFRRSRAAGGPVEQWKDRQGRLAMIRAAAELSPTYWPVAEHHPEVHLLTGKKFWYQTAFCLRSLEHHSRSAFRTVLHDDGTLDDAVAAKLAAIFPHAALQRGKEAEERVARLLPRERFPVLHERRDHYPQLRKLIDVHLGRSGWRLVLDSDMLFFRRPDALLEWLNRPERPLHLCDIAEAYGYPRELLEEIAGTSVPSKVNVGALGFDSGRVDWDEVESQCRRLIAARGTSYYLEQALAALLLSRATATCLDASDYIVGPSRDACFPPRAVLHHYVAESKRWYFRQTWQACGVTAPRAETRMN